VQACKGCSGGQKAGNLGSGGGDALATATVGLPWGAGANTILIKDASGAAVTVDSLDVVM
jgi:hypothetical protein